MNYKVYRKNIDGNTHSVIIKMPENTETNRELYFSHIREQKEQGYRQVILAGWVMNKVLTKLIWDGWKVINCIPGSDLSENASIYFELVKHGYPFIPEYMELIDESCDINSITLSKNGNIVTLKINGLITMNSFDKTVEYLINETINQYVI